MKNKLTVSKQQQQQQTTSKVVVRFALVRRLQKEWQIWEKHLRKVDELHLLAAKHTSKLWTRFDTQWRRRLMMMMMMFHRAIIIIIIVQKCSRRHQKFTAGRCRRVMMKHCRRSDPVHHFVAGCFVSWLKIVLLLWLLLSLAVWYNCFSFPFCFYFRLAFSGNKSETQSKQKLNHQNRCCSNPNKQHLKTV